VVPTIWQLTGISDRLGSGNLVKRRTYQEMSWAKIGEAIWINWKSENSDMPVLGIMGTVTKMLHICSRSDKHSKWLKSLHILSLGYTRLAATIDCILRSSGMSSIICIFPTEGHEVADCWSHCGPCQHSCRFTNLSCVTLCEDQQDCRKWVHFASC